MYQKTKNILLLFIIVNIAGIARVEAQSITDFINYYSFDNTLNDSGTNGNNGVANGTGFVSDRFGEENSAIEFLSTGNNYVELTNTLGNLSFIHQTHDFGISLFVKVNDLTNDQMLVANSQGTLEDGFYLQIKNNSPRFVSFFGQSGVRNELISTTTINDNDWHHVVLTGDGANVSMYLDGQNVGVLNNVTQSTVNELVNLHVGIFRSASGSVNGSSAFSGEMDELKIYNHGLSQQNVNDLYFTSPANAAQWKEIGGTLSPFNPSHKVAIGTDAVPGEYVLAVNGKAIMEGVKVQIYEEWPDYVFSKEYDLKDLSLLEEYIKKNNHLPNIPSAEEVKLNGIELGAMNVKLLEKIEELTLYLIEIEKQNNVLREKQSKMDELLKRIEKIEEERMK